MPIRFASSVCVIPALTQAIVMNCFSVMMISPLSKLLFNLILVYKKANQIAILKLEKLIVYQ